MGWLTYSDDEVRSFHPAFKDAVDEALGKACLEDKYKWVHHPSRGPKKIFPDFVLADKKTGQWFLAVEVKRRKEAVYSTRNQYQAKSYAEDNANRYPPQTARFFAISNLETSILFALHDGRPPLECQVKDGTYQSGDFRSDALVDHRAKFIDDWIHVCKSVTSTDHVEFEVVWPSVLEALLTHALNVKPSPIIALPTPKTSNWPLIQSYFGEVSNLNAARLFLLRCLLVEYLRGTLFYVHDDRAAKIPSLRTERLQSSLANALDALRGIDFHALFEDSSPDLYRNLADPDLLRSLRSYVEDLLAKKVVQLASRVDALELLDTLFSRTHPFERLPLDGKVQTDPDLADILAVLTIKEKPALVYDPGCGNGTLLSAAFDRLVDLGVNGTAAIESLVGIEADEMSMRIASLRLALRNPRLLKPSLKLKIFLGDLFAYPDLVKKADTVLMNPPFKRYESQDEKPVPQELRDHYNSAIKAIDGKSATSTKGQTNLFNYYVEFVAKAARPGTRLGIILDNKWYHNSYGERLRQMLLKDFRIHAIIEYPHDLYFKGYTVTTSMLILEKAKKVSKSHKVAFIRSRVDPQEAGTSAIAKAFHLGAEWPPDWFVRYVPQSNLNEKIGWKTNFHDPLKNDYLKNLPPFVTLFGLSRRGSLNKEGAGTGVIDFPFNQVDYGPKRTKVPGKHRPWVTRVAGDLTPLQNEQIKLLASRIQIDYHGWAIRNADDLTKYVLDEFDVTRTETLEPPDLRGDASFFANKRVAWSSDLKRALAKMKSNKSVAPFIHKLSRAVGLNEHTLPPEELWVTLREPYAGELIVPRKMRTGHRVHINPFAFDSSGRQFRISSNFISYMNCLATDPSSDLDKRTATTLIAAFLVSSFGQLQFEREGYNREGVLCVEMSHLSRIKVIDPRRVDPKARDAIIDAFNNLPYPISTDKLSSAHPERNELDKLIAGELCRLDGKDNQAELIEEVHDALDRWVESRQP